MDKPQKILFYNDASIVGGHEVMSLAASDAMREFCGDLQIEWIIDPTDEPMARRLQERNYRVHDLHPLPHDGLLQNPWRTIQAILANAWRLRRIHPDVVVVAQGIVTFSMLGNLATRLAGLRHCCYQPMGAIASECDNNHAPYWLDAIWRLCFRCIKSFITIDQEQKRLILRQAPHAQVLVVENLAPFVAARFSRQEARRHLGIGDEKRIITGVVARIEFAQKNQLWLLEKLAEDAYWKKYLTLFIGDGGDMPALRARAAELGLKDHIRLMGWRDDIAKLYPAFDLLLLPSRSEGVPLVMLEALSYKIPVVATDRDGMREWLPKEWRFPFNDSVAMRRAIEWALSAPAPREFWEKTDKHLAQLRNRQRFANEFCNAIFKLAQ